MSLYLLCCLHFGFSTASRFLPGLHRAFGVPPRPRQRGQGCNGKRVCCHLAKVDKSTGASRQLPCVCTCLLLHAQTQLLRWRWQNLQTSTPSNGVPRFAVRPSNAQLLQHLLFRKGNLLWNALFQAPCRGFPCACARASALFPRSKQLVAPWWAFGGVCVCLQRQTKRRCGAKQGLGKEFSPQHSLQKTNETDCKKLSKLRAIEMPLYLQCGACFGAVAKRFCANRWLIDKRIFKQMAVVM